MTLLDSPSRGVVTAVGGDEQTHRRLVDLGLLGARYEICARRRSAVLVDYGDFAAVSSRDVAGMISVAPDKSKSV